MTTEPLITAPSPDPRTPTYVEAVKLLGPGNSTGFFGGLVALYYFNASWPKAVIPIELAAGVYLVGIGLFAIAFWLLTIFIIKQVSPRPDPAGVELTRQRAVGFAVASFVAWWIGTMLAVLAVLIIMFARHP